MVTHDSEKLRLTVVNFLIRIATCGPGEESRYLCGCHGVQELLYAVLLRLLELVKPVDLLQTACFLQVSEGGHD